MSFEKEYKQKLTVADEAVKVIESGDWIDYGWTVTTPVELDIALAKRIKDLINLNIRGGNLLWEPEIFKINEAKEHFTWNSWHVGMLKE